MPKSIRFHALGGPEVLSLEEAAPRPLEAGEVTLDVSAVGLNRADSMYFRGQHREPPQLPAGLGVEAVGTVAAVGPGGDDALVGKRFGVLSTVPGFSRNKYPVLAEQAIVPADALAALPDRLSDTEGAAVWTAYTTAYGALVHFGKVAAGDFVLLNAASSSVGLAAIQVVRAQGAVSIAATRTASKRAELLRLGADHVIVTGEEDLPARVRAITGGKLARFVFDPVGGDYINTLGQATADGGFIYLYGVLSGQPTPFPMSVFTRRVGMYGYSVIEIREAAPLAAMKRYVYEHLADGTFRPQVARTFAFDQTAAAYQYLESNAQVGKVVVTF